MIGARGSASDRVSELHRDSKQPLRQFLQQRPGRRRGTIAEGAVEGVGDGLNAGAGEGLEALGEVGPAQQSAGGESDFDALGEAAGRADAAAGWIAEKETADLVGVVDHGAAQAFGKGGGSAVEQAALGLGRGVTDLAEGEAVHEGEVLAQGALVKAGLIGGTIGIGGGDEAEQRVGRDNLAAILRQAERRAVENAIEADGDGGIEQVDLVEQKEAAVAHGERQRAVLEAHAATINAEMPSEIGELQPPVTGDLEDRIVQLGRHLPDQAALAAAGGAEDVERIGGGHQPDHEFAHGFGEDVEGIVAGRVGAGRGETPDQATGGLAAEDQACIEVGGGQPG